MAEARMRTAVIEGWGSSVADSLKGDRRFICPRRRAIELPDAEASRSRGTSPSQVIDMPTDVSLGDASLRARPRHQGEIDALFLGNPPCNGRCRDTFGGPTAFTLGHDRQLGSSTRLTGRGAIGNDGGRFPLTEQVANQSPNRQGTGFRHDDMEQTIGIRLHLNLGFLSLYDEQRLAGLYVLARRSQPTRYP